MRKKKQKMHFFFEVYLGIFWEIPMFLKTKKNRSEIASSFPAVARLDLSHVSENKGFGNSQTPTFGVHYSEQDLRLSSFIKKFALARPSIS